MGNVINGPEGLSEQQGSTLYKHEFAHTTEAWLGAGYIPSHLADLTVGYTGKALGQGYSWFILEEHSQPYPYSKF